MRPDRLLVVDDSVTVRKVFLMAFETEDLEVVAVDTAREAYALAAEEPFAMVITDTDMPGMDGFDLCLALKRNEMTNKTPVYLLASSLMDFDGERAELVGADGKFEKPFRSEEMVRQTLKVISEKGPVKAPKLADGPSWQDDFEDDSFQDFGEELDGMLEEAEMEVDLEKAMEMEEKINAAVEKKFAHLARDKKFHDIMEDLLGKALEKRLLDERLDEKVKEEVEAAVSKFGPLLSKEARDVAQKVALNTAEKVVKEVLGRLKGE